MYNRIFTVFHRHIDATGKFQVRQNNKHEQDEHIIETTSRFLPVGETNETYPFTI